MNKRGSKGRRKIKVKESKQKRKTNERGKKGPKIKNGDAKEEWKRGKQKKIEEEKKEVVK